MKMRYRFRLLLILSVLVLATLLLAGCAPSGWLTTPTPTIDLPAALTALAPSPEVSLPTLAISLNPAPTPVTEQPSDQPNPPKEVTQRLWVAPYLPDDLMQGMVAPVAIQIVSDPLLATLQLDVSSQGVQVSSLVFALVAPFPTLTDQISFADLITAWQGNPGEYLSAAVFISLSTPA